MGTRNLTTIRYNGETKVAQYGQWDGYPSGVGIDILETLRSVANKFSNERFFLEKNLERTRFLTNEEMRDIDCKLSNGEISLMESYPLLHRDNAGNVILDFLTEELREEVVLKDTSEFVNDTLFCEYHYDIDLDAGIFSVNTIHSWSFENLPTMDEFYQAFENDDDDY